MKNMRKNIQIGQSTKYGKTIIYITVNIFFKRKESILSISVTSRTKSLGEKSAKEQTFFFF